MDNKHDILCLLRSVANGETKPEDALLELKEAPFEDLGYAKVDLHRSVRQGSAEVIYGAGKTPEQIAGIAAAMGAVSYTHLDVYKRQGIYEMMHAKRQK